MVRAHKVFYLVLLLSLLGFKSSLIAILKLFVSVLLEVTDARHLSSVPDFKPDP
jgi:hypothetical protein